MSLSSPSVAVAGGGIIGLSTAWRLAQRGFRVTVFDQSTLGGEASWAGAGMLAPGGEIEEPSELARIALESRRLYPAFVRELERESGLSIDFQELGAIDLAYSLEELTTLETRAAKQSAMGIESQPIATDQVKALCPQVRSQGLFGARLYSGDGMVNPREVVTALRTVCQNRGVRLVENCVVLGIFHQGQGVGISTAKGLETHQAALVAAGAWSGSIAVNPLPIPASWPIKGHLIGYHQAAQTCNIIIRHGHRYLVQRANGLLIVGTSVEHAGFDRRIDPQIVSQLSSAAGFVMPSLLETSPAEAWVGFRPESEQLHLGRWQSSHIYLAYGHYRNGILLAPLSAEILAGEISASLETR